MIVLPRELRLFENIRISHGVRSTKMDKLTPPEQLNLESGNLAENWRQWRQRFDIFSLATGLSEKSDKVQLATLLHVAGPTALEVYNTFTWDEDGDEQKVNKILQKFENYCKPRKNITWERHVFNTRNQQTGESIDQYVTDLKIKARSCEFGELHDSLIRDQIVCGIACDKTRGTMLREGDIPLQRAVDLCRAAEATKAQLKSISSASATADNITTEAEIHFIRNKHKREANKQVCTRCGHKHTSNQNCPAQGVECYKCGRKNHFAKVCKTAPFKQHPSRVHAIECNSSDESDDMFIGMIQAGSKSKDWKATILLNRQKTTFKLDVISKTKYNQISPEPLRASRARLVAFGSTQLHTCGKATITCQHKGRHYAIQFEVVDQNIPSILGLETCTKLNLVQRVDAIEKRTQNILSEYNDVFNGLGCITNVVYHIEIDKQSNPVIHPPRRIPVTL